MRLSWRCSGIDQKVSVMREEPPWDLLVLVLFFFSDFLEKLPCLCKVECGVTSGLTQVWHPHLVPPVPRMENFPLHFLHDLSPGKSWAPMPTHPHPCLYRFSLSIHIPPRHICPCFWQPLTFLSPQFHKPLLKCSPLGISKYSLSSFLLLPMAIWTHRELWKKKWRDSTLGQWLFFFSFPVNSVPSAGPGCLFISTEHYSESSVLKMINF